ncbi:Dicarboxylic amino acid permease [Meyerozyma sp. JA9]|nr:Dicarboxylic amino acid permease [Meyerozyma sp. JA9]
MSASPEFKSATVKDAGVVETESLKSNASGEEGGLLEYDRTLLNQGLRQRHIQMFALVGVFGTGLFLSSGGTLRKTGPVGMLIGYILVGTVVGFNQLAIAEVGSFMPATGSTVRHAEQFIDESVGFAYGWISVYAAIIPSELAAAAVVVKYWTDVSSAVFISVFAVLFILTNIYTVRFYGEVEYFFGWLKILLIVGLIFTSLVIVCGGGPNHHAIGFQYWRDPGPFAEYIFTGARGRMCGVWAAISSIVYSFGGVQSLALLAGETKNNRHAIFYGARNIFLRVITLYIITVLFLTMIVPYNDPRIASGTGTAQSSPFVIAITNAKIKVLPHIINAIVLTSAWSAANLSLVQGSRNLFSLAAKNQAPKIFLKTTKRGVPYYGVAFVAMFLPLAYMSVSATAGTIFGWFQGLTSSNLLLGWILISANHIHMDRALKAQGYSRKSLPYSTRFGPFGAWFSGIMSVIFLLTGGFTNFISGQFAIESFFTSYFIIPLSIGLYTFWKLFKKTRYLRPEEVDLKSIFDDIEANPEYIPESNWRSFFRTVFT